MSTAPIPAAAGLQPLPGFPPAATASPSRRQRLLVARDLAAELASDPGLAARYRAKVWTAGADPGHCHLWLGALNGDTGHAKLHIRYEPLPPAEPGRRPVLAEWVDYGHHLAWLLAGEVALGPGEVVRHSCDEPACQNAAHLRVGTRADNYADWAARRFSWLGPLNDPRGPDGRARALQAAVAAALAAGRDLGAQRAAYATAARAGHEQVGQLTLLPTADYPS